VASAALDGSKDVVKRVVLLLALLTGCPSDGEIPEDIPDPTPFVDVREPCASTTPLRDVFWGDLHAHTSWSFDAWVFDVRIDPEEAYRFARGEEVLLPPLDGDGRGTQSLRLERPLDFAAVTDHAEYLAEVAGCTSPDSPIYNFPTCEQYRMGGNGSVFEFGIKLTEVVPERFDEICGSFGLDCVEEARPLWQRLQAIAEAAYDRTAACEFTSLIAYEYTAATGISNLHRNVIFRNATVPAQPAAYFEHETPQKLWDALRAECLEADGPCDVLAIPHNSNWSNGRLFQVEYTGTTEAEQAAEAEARAQLEPIMEIYQHKGDSECSPGLSGILGAPDELCTFEKLRVPPFGDCGDGTGGGAMGGLGCLSRADFLRGALLRGLEEEARIGANPLPLGVIASTDTHNGIPGAVEEDAYLGHWGNNEDLPERRLGTGALTPGGVIFSSGGLAAVWAESNDRDAIFDALRRREVYGTSGPRITVRLFGGAALPEDLCERVDAIEVADDLGVPMGGTLDPTDGAPRFFLWAAMDPGTTARPGTALERIQIVKGWIDAGGERHVEVFDVGGGVGDAGVDTATCAARGTSGASELCAVWTDPSFDPAERAWYYARVVENPTCRWSTWACIGLPEDDRPESCDRPDVPKTIQERAWTSPIWVSPL
jgi:hypothetical protein